METRRAAYVLALLVLMQAAVGASALAAASAAIDPGALSGVAGQRYSLAVRLDPHGEKIYTGKIMLTYPSDLVEITGFRFGSGWLALSQPGYDAIDAAQGSIIKTAGFAGGIDAAGTFGTVLFRMKKSGAGSFAVAGGTQLLNAAGENVFDGAIRTARLSVSSAPASASSAARTPVRAPAREPLPATAPAGAAAGEPKANSVERLGLASASAGGFSAKTLAAGAFLGAGLALLGMFLAGVARRLYTARRYAGGLMGKPFKNG